MFVKVGDMFLILFSQRIGSFLSYFRKESVLILNLIGPFNHFILLLINILSRLLSFDNVEHKFRKSQYIEYI